MQKLVIKRTDSESLHVTAANVFIRKFVERGTHHLIKCGLRRNMPTFLAFNGFDFHEQMSDTLFIDYFVHALYLVAVVQSLWMHSP